MRKFIVMSLCVLAAAFSAGRVIAESIEFEFGGTVTSVDPGFQGCDPPWDNVNVNDQWSIVYVFESTTPDTDGANDHDEYAAITSYTLNIGGNVVSDSGLLGERISIFSNRPVGWDQYEVWISVPNGYEWFMQLDDSTGTAWDSNTLPLCGDIELSNFGLRDFSLGGGGGGFEDCEIRGSVDYHKCSSEACEVLVYKDDIKWSQPPVEVDEGIINGWDEYSSYFDSPIVADDWVCTDDRPIKDIHWWGSFKGWNECVPPSDAPSAFHIGIWTDVPDPDPNNAHTFSHPDKLVWEKITDCYVWSCAGSDLDPRGIDGDDTCFKFDQLLSQDEWFYQDSIGGTQSFTGGVADDFDLTNAEPAVALGLFGVWVDARFGLPRNFDGEPSDWDRTFGHTLQFALPTTFQITEAELEIHLKADSGSITTNDTLLLEYAGDGSAGNWVWSRNIKELPLQPGGMPVGSWEHNEEGTFTLDLGQLPTANGVISILDHLADGELEICVADDTRVDYVTLTLEGVNVYWLSIAAIYEGLTPQYPWGWKTRPHFCNDDAVRILPPVSVCPSDCNSPDYSEFPSGIPDEFDPNNHEPTAPSPQLLALYGNPADFDELAADHHFGHTITGLPPCIVRAELEISLRGVSFLACNDTISLQMTGGTPRFAWGRRIGTRGTSSLCDGPDGLLGTGWGNGTQNIFHLDLSVLPNVDGTTTDLRPLLNADGHLDVYLHDDTAVDYMILRVWSCPLVPDQWPPSVGSFWENGEPIEYPEGTSWDMAFVLTSNRKYEPKKWHWPNDESSAVDLYPDGKIDLKDYAVFASYWLEQAQLCPLCP